MWIESKPAWSPSTIQLILPTYRAPITPEDLREPDELAHPVLQIAAQRVREGSRPGARTDPHRLALAIEGGGMGGAVSAGMCVMLDALGLIPAFDAIYGCSSGALNGLWTAAGQAPLGATNFEDAASRKFISLLHLLFGRPIVNLTFLFNRIAVQGKTYSPEQLALGPDFNVLITIVERSEVISVKGLGSPAETLAAVRASCALPLIGGRLPYFRGELAADGGLIEAVPFESVLAGGASHVLVLRSRAAEHRVKRESRLTLAAVERQHPALRELLQQSHVHYNATAQRLAELAFDPELGARAMQITVPGAAVVGRLDHNRLRVIAGLQAGAQAVAKLVLGDSVGLLWQPQAYHVSETALQEWLAPAPQRTTQLDSSREAGKARARAWAMRRARAA
ncbi:MAG TPA: patatin-like phospholipase family protein [Solirubrobacteraceae bacterium]|jgi:predicted patatin/cPLA2 family phospholipase